MRPGKIFSTAGLEEVQHTLGKLLPKKMSMLYKFFFEEKHIRHYDRWVVDLHITGLIVPDFQCPLGLQTH